LGAVAPLPPATSHDSTENGVCGLGLQDHTYDKSFSSRQWLPMLEPWK